MNPPRAAQQPILRPTIKPIFGFEVFYVGGFWVDYKGNCDCACSCPCSDLRFGLLGVYSGCEALDSVEFELMSWTVSFCLNKVQVTVWHRSRSSSMLASSRALWRGLRFQFGSPYFFQGSLRLRQASCITLHLPVLWNFMAILRLCFSRFLGLRIFWLSFILGLDW